MLLSLLVAGPMQKRVLQQLTALYDWERHTAVNTGRRTIARRRGIGHDDRIFRAALVANEELHIPGRTATHVRQLHRLGGSCFAVDQTGPYSAVGAAVT
jgi:hypothetical protein